jgi:hypothetical protein
MEEGSVSVPLTEPFHTRALPSHNLFSLKELTKLALNTLLLSHHILRRMGIAKGT